MELKIYILIIDINGYDYIYGTQKISILLLLLKANRLYHDLKKACREETQGHLRQSLHVLMTMPVLNI